jgi:hypothetical protein
VTRIHLEAAKEMAITYDLEENMLSKPKDNELGVNEISPNYFRTPPY